MSPHQHGAQSTLNMSLKILNLNLNRRHKLSDKDILFLIAHILIRLIDLN